MGKEAIFSAIFLFLGLAYFIAALIPLSPEFNFAFSLLNTLVISDILAFAAAALIAIIFFYYQVYSKDRIGFLFFLIMGLLFLPMGISFLIGVYGIFGIPLALFPPVFAIMLARQFILILPARKSSEELKLCLENNFFPIFTTLAFSLAWFAVMFFALYILLRGFWTYNEVYFMRLLLAPIGLFYFWAHTAKAKNQFVGLFKKLGLESQPFGEIRLKKVSK